MGAGLRRSRRPHGGGKDRGGRRRPGDRYHRGPDRSHRAGHRPGPDQATGYLDRIGRVVQLAVAQDVGRALNPQSVMGQIEGGSAQGLGLALMEEVALVDGQVKNASFTDYLLPTILDMPPVVCELVEEPEPGLPYGAKGVGEPSTVVVPAAVVAALRHATGRELRRAPVKPDDLVGL